MARVAVVGGGVSGLAAAFYLERLAPPDTEIVLFEQSRHLGGVIASARENGYVWEMGPDSFLSNKPAGIQLVEELGLTDRLVNSNLRSVFVVRGGRLVPFPTGFQFFVPSQWRALLSAELLGWGSKFTALREMFRHRAAQGEDISVADFVRSRLGTEIYDYLAEPLLSGIYGGDAEQLSMASVLPQFLAYEQSHGNVVRGALRSASKASTSKWSMFVSFRDGMQELTDGIAAALKRTTVHPGQPIEEVRDGRVQGQAFDAVVLAAPAHVSARLLRAWAPGVAEILATIPYTTSTTVSLGYHAADLPVSEGGFGFVAPRKENRRILACSWLSAKFAGRAPEGRTYVRGFLTGGSDASDEQVTNTVLDELRSLMDVTKPPEHVRIARWPAAMAQPVIGHKQRIQTLRERLTAYPRLKLAGNYLDGIGIPDCIRSARSAAESIASELRGAR